MSTLTLEPSAATTTPPIEGHELIKYGFLHVTGLHAFDPLSHADNPWSVITPTVGSLGKMGTNNGYVVVITERGKVWLGLNPKFYEGVPDHEGHTRYLAYNQLIRKICPNADGDVGAEAAFVAIVNCAELIRPSEMLERMRDPFYKAEVWHGDKR